MKTHSGNTVKLTLFSFTLFLSAALMFALQPMVGKMLLPIVGGTPSGWVVAMAFFQVALLAGYFLAHALSRFSLFRQGALYILCLCLGVPFLPVALSGHAGIAGPTPMAWDVFLLLSFVVAIPFIALSATASTVQRLFTATGHPAADDPYFLYAASNLGSFCGLLLYPFVVEPYLSLSLQSKVWAVGYGALAVFAVFCLLLSKGEGVSRLSAVPVRSPPPSWSQRRQWLFLSCLPSALLLAVTGHITTDIISVPLLWVLPLGVYLLTFVIAFARKPLVSYESVVRAQPAAVAVAIALSMLATSAWGVSWTAMCVHLAAFGIVALMCHMRLAAARPIDSPAHLTAFYLMLSIGGALGGVTVAFIAPAVLDRLIEYPLLMALSPLLNPRIHSRLDKTSLYAFIAAFALIGAFALIDKQGIKEDALRNIPLILIFVLITLHPKASLVGSLMVFVGTMAHAWYHPALFTDRNFYGVIKVYDAKLPSKKESEDTALSARFMRHGTTMHGFQILDKKLETAPTSYYTSDGPLGGIFSALRPKSVAVAGLGTGTVNCAVPRGADVTFFEIDPAVVEMAQEKFTFLSKCNSRSPRLVTGDARLEIAKITDKKFDLILLDAFSSDMVPTHLLTKEAMELYRQRLSSRGVIVFHISNRYFALEKPIAAAASALGLQGLMLEKSSPGKYAFIPSSKWMIVGANLSQFQNLIRQGWLPVDPGKTRPWTDDYTNLLSSLAVIRASGSK